MIHKIINLIETKKITTIFHLLTGALFTFLIIYLRFIRARPIGPLDSTYTSLKFWLILGSLFLFYMLLMFTLCLPFYLGIIAHEYLNQYRIEDRKFLGFFSKTMGYISESQKTFWTPVMNYIINRFPEKFVGFVTYITKLDIYIEKFILFVYFFPPLLIATIFFIETSFYKEYTYFPYSIFLMILPFSWRALLYMLRYFCEQFLEQRSSKTLIQEGTDPNTGNLIYGWSPEASKYDITSEELQSYESLLIEVAMKHKYEENLKLFNLWTLYLTISRHKYYCQIPTYALFFTATWIKLGLLH